MMSKRRSRSGATDESAFGPRAQERMLRQRDWRKRVGWTLVVVGAISFIGGNIGARTGLTFLPIDPHHVYTQIAGALVGLSGLILMTSDTKRRR